MKMPMDMYETLRDAVAPFMTPENAAAFRDAGLTAKRFRWDCSTAAWHSKDNEWSPLKAYALEMNDDHIDTALRRAMRDHGIDYDKSEVK